MTEYAWERLTAPELKARAAAGALFSTTPRRFTFFRISAPETGIAGVAPPRLA